MKNKIVSVIFATLGIAVSGFAQSSEPQYQVIVEHMDRQMCQQMQGFLSIGTCKQHVTIIVYSKHSPDAYKITLSYTDANGEQSSTQVVPAPHGQSGSGVAVYYLDDVTLHSALAVPLESAGKSVSVAAH